MRRLLTFVCLTALSACSLFVGLDDLAGNGEDGGALGDRDVTPTLPDNDGPVFPEVDGVAPECNKDTRSDPDNCGACDQRCISGVCNEGSCAPGLIGVGGYPYGLAATDAGVFMSSDFGDRLLRFPRELDASPDELAKGATGGGFYRVVPYDGERVLVNRRIADDAGSNGLWKLGADDELELVRSEPNTYAMHGDADGVYMSAYTETTGTTATRLRVFTRNPLKLAFTVDAASDGTTASINEISSDAKYIYFSQSTIVKRVPKTGPGSAVETIATSPSTVRHLAADDTNLYIDTYSCTAPVYRVDKAKGGIVQPFIAEPYCATGIEVRDGYLYFGYSRSTDGGKHAGVARAKLDTAAIEEVSAVDGGGTPYVVASDGHQIFFATGVDGTYQVWVSGR